MSALEDEITNAKAACLRLILEAANSGGTLEDRAGVMRTAAEAYATLTDTSVSFDEAAE
jgi:hypothetical protein